ncbi:PLP-dependent cysteine synthase family protein [Roseibacillus persicicus]|uniref:PLP-dependent cysteine synthase family protein n=1 Tax=Roseibacillus persicicus TaxID=454148 RepID=UPI00280E94B2|nr:cysteine synthase family protein [Roseibacillus persicicus]MDQ8189776.1 cysteine synthase family protein [Roseibacillus persicicus]
MIHQSLTDLIGKTPLLRLNAFAPDHQILAKCEFMNPVSIKDRPVREILLQAEARGDLKKGGTIIEATSGNTGMALASLGNRLGYRVIIVMSEIQSVERRMVMKALGAEVVLTPAALGTKGAKARLDELCAENPDYFYLGQHISADNPKAHYRTTGPEIWEDTAGKVDILIAALGTGGTISGAGRYLKEQNPAVQCIAIEPEVAPYISQGIFSPHRIMGTAPGFVPEAMDQSVIDSFELISEEEAFATCREIAASEGVLVGITSGANAAVARRVAQRPENEGKTIVCIFCDTGERYLTVEGLFD